MSESILVAFASGSDDLIPTMLERMGEIYPGLPLYVVSEFQVDGAIWVPYHIGRTQAQNLALCRAAFAGKRIQLAGLILQPRMPYLRLRLLALQVAGPLRTAFFNENLDHFLLRPRSAGAIARHILWRASNLVRWELRPGGATYTFLWRLLHPWAFLRPLALYAARLSGWLAATARKMDRVAQASAWPAGSSAGARALESGVSVVIPSRNGRDLLARLLPGLIKQKPEQIIVVDNGSADGTDDWLRRDYPHVITVVSREPLSFARAVNRGIAAAAHQRVLLLNNDMIVEPRFLAALEAAFRAVPDLLCATAQILFPEGQRREETGKAVMPRETEPEDFPVRCDAPIEGEDHSYVLYGSGGCSLYDTRKLRELGGMLEIYEPAYVEDLDLGFRGWQRGWPTVFVAGAKVVHRHRATTSRYYSPDELDRVLEVNYLKFLAHTIHEGAVYSRMWARALDRLNRRASRMEPLRPAVHALRRASAIALGGRPHRNPTAIPEEQILAIGSGDVAVFPGAAARGLPMVAIASPYVPFPLSHGGAVRMYNLMRGAAAHYDQALVCFADALETPPRELLELCTEIVLVRRHATHARPLSARPGVVDEFDSPAFRQALRLTVAKRKPFAVQLEFTQLAQYAGDCGGARTILVEHDVTLDLYRQLLDRREDWETRQQYERWVRFERDAWTKVDAVVAMSEQDRRAVGPRAVVLPNGVDLERFRPSDAEPDPLRLLFIGSFAHLPNLLAIDWFLREVWPRVRARHDARLHVIAGARPSYFLERYRDQVAPPLDQEGVELEAFVADPRPAYSRAAIVVAPLRASAGTNIKIMEAMAMGKAMVSTPAGINGLDELQAGRDLIVATTPEETAREIAALLENPGARRALERTARATVARLYSWDAVAARQRSLYERLRVLA